MLKRLAAPLIALLFPLSALANGGEGYDVFPVQMSVSYLFEDDDSDGSGHILAASVPTDDVSTLEFLTMFDFSEENGEQLGILLDYYGDNWLVAYETGDGGGESSYYAYLLAAIHHTFEGTTLSTEDGEGEELSFVEVSVQDLHFASEPCYGSSIDGYQVGVNRDQFRYRLDPEGEGRVPLSDNGVLRTSLSTLLGELSIHNYDDYGWDDFLVVGGSLSAILHPRRADHVSYVTCYGGGID